MRLTNQIADKQVTSKRMASRNPYALRCVFAKPIKIRARLSSLAKPVKLLQSSTFVVCLVFVLTHIGDSTCSVLSSLLCYSK